MDSKPAKRGKYGKGKERVTGNPKPLVNEGEIHYKKGQRIRVRAILPLTTGIEVYRRVRYNLPGGGEKRAWIKHIMYTQSQAHRKGIPYKVMEDLRHRDVWGSEHLLVNATIVNGTEVLPPMVVPVINASHKSKWGGQNIFRRGADVVLTLATRTWFLKFVDTGTRRGHEIEEEPTALLSRDSRRSTITEFMQDGVTQQHHDFVYRFVELLIGGILPSKAAAQSYREVFGKARTGPGFFITDSYPLDFVIRCTEILRVNMAGGNELKAALDAGEVTLEFLVNKYKDLADDDDSKNQLVALDRLVGLRQLAGDVPFPPGKGGDVPDKLPPGRPPAEQAALPPGDEIAPTRLMIAGKKKDQ